MDSNALYPYQPNQQVEVCIRDDEEIYFYTGIVVGMATTPNAVPGMGTLWIVQINEPMPNYSYSCIAVPATAMKPMEAL